jgi:cell division protein FtsL
MKRVENNIKMYESRIADQYKELGKLSEEVIKCSEPPKLTVFE